MELKTLGNDEISTIKSSLTINTFTQCVTELVLNSLDAKATAIAVRINMVNHQIQVVDNGDGISKQNLELLGKCYMTNKCHALSDLHKGCKYYGFRGEALASICNIATRLIITSRLRKSETTYKRIITERSSKAIQSNPRPSCGTTVTIEGLFKRLPVRQKAIKEDLEFENLKKALESLIIIHHEVSYTLRNDVTGALVVNSHKHSSVTNALKFLHPDLDEEKLKPLKYSRRKFTIEALFYEDVCHNKKAQYFYVNKRPVVHQEIQKFICSTLLKGNKNKASKLMKSLTESSKNKHPVYVINIKCPYSEVDLLLTPSKYQVNFKNTSAVSVCIEKTISSFLGSKTTSNVEPPRDENNKKFPMSVCGLSRIAGAVRGNAYRWNDNDNNVTEEQQNLFEDNYVIEDDTRNFIEITQQNPKNHNNIAKRKSNTVSELKSKRLKIEKKPLPIKLNVKPVDHKLKKPVQKCKMKSKKRNNNSKPKTAAIKCDPITKANSVTQNQKDDDFYKRICSTFKSNLPLQADPDGSIKGKEIIMNKFLKASQVYKNNDYNLDENSGSNENYFFNLSRTEEFENYNESLENLASASKLNQKGESTGDLFGPFAAPCNIGNTSGNKTIISGGDFTRDRENSLSFNEPNQDCNLEVCSNNDNKNKSQQFSIEAFRQSLTQKSKSVHSEDSTFIRSSNNIYKSKGIQTSFFTVKNKEVKQRKNENNKTSKCIQTTIVEPVKSPPCFELSQNNGTRKTQNYENFNLKNNFQDVNSHRIKNKNNVSDDIKLPRSIIPKQHGVEKEPYHQKFEQRFDSTENQYIVNEDINVPYKFSLRQDKVDYVPYQNFQQNFNEEMNPFETNLLQGDKVISLDNGNKVLPPSKKISFSPNKFEYVQMKGHIENQIERKSMKNYVSNYDYNFAQIDEIPQIHPEKEDNNPYYFCLKDMTVKLFDCHERKFQKLQPPRRDPWGTHFQPPEIKSVNHPNLYYDEFPQQIIRHDHNFQPIVDKQFNFLSNDLNHKSTQNPKFERNVEASVDRIELSPISRVNINNNIRDIKPSCSEFPENHRISKMSLKKTAKENEKATIKELQNHPLYTEFDSEGRRPTFSLRNINDEAYQKPNLSLADLTSMKMIPTERKYRKKITDLDTSRFFAASSVNTSHYFAPFKDTFDLNKKKLGPPRDHSKKKNVELNISLLDISSKIKNDTTLNHEVSLEIGPSFGNFNPPFKSTQNFQGSSPKTTLKLSGLSQNKKNQNNPLFGVNYSDAPRMKSPMNSTFPCFDLDYGVENLDHQNAVEVTFPIHNGCNNKTKNAEILFSKQNQDENGDEEDSAEIIDSSIDFEGNLRKKNAILQKKLPFRFDNCIPVNINESLQEKENTNKETIVAEQQECSIPGSPVKSQAKNHSHESEQEWMKILDQFGTTFYFNKRTGMTTFYSPKSEENFGLALRSEFVPKGLSPILIESKKVEKTLSACEKQKLQEAIMKSYQDELLIIKWENFVDLQDPGKFFSQLYSEKSKKFRSSIPSAKSSSKNAKAISFNKSLFKDVSVIGQLDMKFIVTVTKSTHHLILFDQHAVHERIRLEDLHDEYDHSSHKMKNIVTIFFQQNDLRLILNHRSYLDKLGFIFEEITNGIKISSIPLCLWKKIFKESEENLNYLSEVIEILINQILEMIKSKSALVHAPPLLENLISMEACRGAFKFGQALTKDVCNKLIHDLQKCNLPFQCAHGRPTLTPLFTFQSYQKPSKFFSRVKFENLSLVK